MSNLLINAIVLFNVVSHGAIFVCDTFQLVPLLDFVTREDGTRSDPHNLRPLELIYAGLTGMAFGTVMAAFLFAKMGIGTMRGASALSLFFHVIYIAHLAINWTIWKTMMHPDAQLLSPEFFLTGHIMWALQAVVLFRLTSDNSSNTAATTSKKKADKSS